MLHLKNFIESADTLKEGAMHLASPRQQWQVSNVLELMSSGPGVHDEMVVAPVRFKKSRPTNNTIC